MCLKIQFGNNLELKCTRLKELPSFLLGHFPVWILYPSAKGQSKKKSGTKTNRKQDSEYKLNMLRLWTSLPGINLGSRGATSTGKRKGTREATAWSHPGLNWFFLCPWDSVGGAVTRPGRQLWLCLPAAGDMDIGLPSKSQLHLLGQTVSATATAARLPADRTECCLRATHSSKCCHIITHWILTRTLGGRSYSLLLQMRTQRGTERSRNLFQALSLVRWQNGSMQSSIKMHKVIMLEELDYAKCINIYTLYNYIIHKIYPE